MTVFQSDMNSEFKRYATFSGFECPEGIWPLQLARAGFYRSATGMESEVKCYACGLVLNLRTLNKDSVMDVHARLAPSCSFVRGSSANQPVPFVDNRAALEWLSQNFSFGDLSMDTPHHSHSLPHILTSTETGSESEGTQSLPILPDNFSLVPLLSDLNTLEQPELTSQMPDLTSLPSDLLSGFANTTLSSVPSTTLFQAGNYSSAPSLEPQPFSSVLGGPREIVVTDGISDGVEGEYPPPMMRETITMEYANTIPPPAQAGELQREIEVTQKLTFDDLGIIIQRPKRPEFATLQKRLETFDNWMGPRLAQSKELIAEAGFYYAGYSDCCRCFYCGGGLKSWEQDDDPWIEHTRWFKTCPFVHTNKGKDFVEAVQSLHLTNTIVHMCDVENEMKRMKSNNFIPSSMDDVSRLLTDEVEMDTQTVDEVCEDVDSDDKIESEAARLNNENQALKQPELCKICLDKEVSIVYIPCGHLVTCAHCAPTVSSCPVCRQPICGQVRIQRSN